MLYLKNVLQIVLLILVAAATSAVAGIVDCRITDYANYPYNKATLESLLPQNQRHVLTGTVARHGNKTGLVTQDDADRLKWEYPLEVTRNSGLPATISYTIIRSTNTLIVRVQPGGKSHPGPEFISRDFVFIQKTDRFARETLAPVSDVRGTCIVQNQTPLPRDLSETAAPTRFPSEPNLLR